MTKETEKKHSFLNVDRKHLMIVFGCMLIQAIPYGLAQNVPPLFVRYLHIDFNFNLAEVGLIITIGAVAASIVSPIGGKFFNKFSTRLVMMCALFVSCFGLFMNAFVTTLPMYLIAMAFIQMGSVVYSGLGVPYLIGLWFGEEKKAQALGIAFAGGSIGNFFLQPIFTTLLRKYAYHSVSGLHFVYLICAITALVVGLLVLFFFIRDYHGATDGTDDKASSTKDQNDKPVLKGIGAKAVRKLPAFWILAGSMLFIGTSIAAQSYQYANYFQKLHFSTAIIGTVGSTFAIACLIGNTGGGWLFAKLGLFKSTLVAFALQFTSCAAMLSLEFVHSSFLAYAWAVLYGLSVFIYMSGPAIIVQGLFGMKESSETLGLYSIFFAVGFATGNVLYGAVADALGYAAAWTFTLILAVIGYVILSTMVHKISKHHYDQVITED